MSDGFVLETALRRLREAVGGDYFGTVELLNAATERIRSLEAMLLDNAKEE